MDSSKMFTNLIELNEEKSLNNFNDDHSQSESLSSTHSTSSSNYENNLPSSMNSFNSLNSSTINQQCNLNMNEIIELIGYFDENTNITGWFNDFDDCSKLYNWNDLQKYLIVKNLLKGLPKLCIKSEHNIKSWLELKTFLYKEFGKKASIYTSHQLLSERKLMDGESFYEYFVIMKELASRGNIDSESLIQYIIAGIPDDIEIKYILYDIKTLDELKEKLKIMTKFQTKILKKRKIKNKLWKNIEKQEQQQEQFVENFQNNASTSYCRCSNCDNFGHGENNCPQNILNTTNQNLTMNNLSSAQIQQIINLILPMFTDNLEEIKDKLNANSEKLTNTKIQVERLCESLSTQIVNIANLTKRVQLLEDREKSVMTTFLQNNLLQKNNDTIKNEKSENLNNNDKKTEVKSTPKKIPKVKNVNETQNSSDSDAASDTSNDSSNKKEPFTLMMENVSKLLEGIFSEMNN